ncbi:MAG TPA: glycosyltransferase, partial [Beijerinckiaceae bacterium]|nr:glycosyltransferase [Beijerinckiaceae bacterium]
NAAYAMGDVRFGPLRLLAVGSIIPRKAYDVMISGLTLLTDLRWRLDIVGATQHAPEAVAALRRQITGAGLEDRVRLCGPLGAEALADAYTGADLFVMTSLYEGYGMVIAEAMARGLPIVAAAGGAIADTLPDEAGIKVPPGDAAAFASGLRRLIVDSDLRQRYAERSWQAGQSLPGWADTAGIIAQVIRRVST